MEEVDAQIGRSIARFRGERSQMELARAMRDRGWKWSQTTVSDVESGQRPLRLGEAADLADEFKLLSTDFFLKSDGDSEITARGRAVKIAADALEAAVHTYWQAQLNLALAGDEVEFKEGLSQLLLNDWLTKRPEDLIAELRKTQQAQGAAELSRLGIDADAAVNGPGDKYLNLFNAHWSADVEH